MGGQLLTRVESKAHFSKGNSNLCLSNTTRAKRSNSSTITYTLVCAEQRTNTASNYSIQAARSNHPSRSEMTVLHARQGRQKHAIRDLACVQRSCLYTYTRLHAIVYMVCM
jgi:hypothetical protein